MKWCLGQRRKIAGGGTEHRHSKLLSDCAGQFHDCLYTVAIGRPQELAGQADQRCSQGNALGGIDAVANTAAGKDR